MAGSKHVDDLRFTSPEELANWLDSLYECYPDGAVGNKKWEAAQVAAQAVRGMSAQQRFVQLPPDWKREGIVVIADALTGRLLGCMGHNTWDAQVRADTAQGGDAKAIISALSDEKAGPVSDGLRERAHTLVTKILSTQPPNVVLQQLEQLREARDLLSEIAASPMPGRKDYD